MPDTYECVQCKKTIPAPDTGELPEGWWEVAFTVPKDAFPEGEYTPFQGFGETTEGYTSVKGYVCVECSEAIKALISPEDVTGVTDVGISLQDIGNEEENDVSGPLDWLGQEIAIDGSGIDFSSAAMSQAEQYRNALVRHMDDLKKTGSVEVTVWEVVFGQNKNMQDCAFITRFEELGQQIAKYTGLLLAVTRFDEAMQRILMARWIITIFETAYELGKTDGMTE